MSDGRTRIGVSWQVINKEKTEKVMKATLQIEKLDNKMFEEASSVSSLVER
jgi:hypothetical protein